MKTYGGNGGIPPPFLTSALDGIEWSASHPCSLTPEEGAPSTHWIGGWVGPRAGLDTLEKRKISHCWESNPGCAASSSTLYWLSYPDSYNFVIELSIMAKPSGTFLQLYYKSTKKWIPNKCCVLRNLPSVCLGRGDSYKIIKFPLLLLLSKGFQNIRLATRNTL
jgi:hypothetical protein